MARKWYPVIDTSKCSQCGACIQRCTHHVYVEETKKPQVIHPESCTACMACQRLCLENAITYAGDTIGDVGCGCSKARKSS